MNILHGRMTGQIVIYVSICGGEVFGGPVNANQMDVKGPDRMEACAMWDDGSGEVWASLPNVNVKCQDGEHVLSLSRLSGPSLPSLPTAAGSI
jgi:hypothetical protein